LGKEKEAMDILAEWVMDAITNVLPSAITLPNILIRILGNYLLLWLGGMFFYLVFATGSYCYFYRWKRHIYYPATLPEDIHVQIRTEIGIALRSMPFMAVLMTPFPIVGQLGYGRMYSKVSDYGWVYLFLSIPLFLVLTDLVIYIIHRGLHTPWLYKNIHKQHHTYRYTTPFSSHAFHPVDGWAQGVPYYLFTFVFPFHNILHIIMFIFVNFWTISIHDQVDYCGGGLLNSTGHHTIHHTEFLFNYGQYFTLWDRLCGSYKPGTQTHNLFSGEKSLVAITKTSEKVE